MRTQSITRSIGGYGLRGVREARRRFTLELSDTLWFLFGLGATLSFRPRAARPGADRRFVGLLATHCCHFMLRVVPLHDSRHNRRRRQPVEEIGAWILACPGIEGVTFSGGEPFQQAPELQLLCEYIRVMKPTLSIGVFTGYTLRELVQGRWHWWNSDGGWTNGDARLFTQIRQFLDFAVCGRFRQPMACSDKPLCGSRNQEVVFFSDRYSQQDLQPQGYEVTISENGTTAIITGFPPVGLTARLLGSARAGT